MECVALTNGMTGGEAFLLSGASYQAARAKKGRKMSKKIMILNGAARKNGHTAELVHAFTQGARSAGHDVREFYLHDKKIAGCLGCHKAGHNPSSPCAQKDDMEDIYAAFHESDVVVFASPVYFWTITGVLKTVADRLYAELECLGYKGFARESVLLTTHGGGSFDQITTWYRAYEKNLGWKNRGEVLGAGKIKEAHDLGASLQAQPAPML